MGDRDMRENVVLVRLNDKENDELNFLANAWGISRAEAMRTLLLFEIKRMTEDVVNAAER
jgi:hypothetical protein